MISPPEQRWPRPDRSFRYATASFGFADQYAVWKYATLLICLVGGFGCAADLNGHILITKVLTKRRISLPGYDAVRFAADAKQTGGPAEEFSRVVVWLEGDHFPVRARSSPAWPSIINGLSQKSL